jgi:aerobic-type carbon monoxide dehydrogenase small subunit (CoxS/CutS family)
MVGASGFEPPASWSRTRRSTRLSHAPNLSSLAVPRYILNAETENQTMPRMIDLVVNGVAHTIDADPDRTLLTVLRDELDLTGSKYGCGEGQCGACTVMIDGLAARSCQTRAGAVGLRRITTIEGLEQHGHLHPLQEAFIEIGAMQCGYCTPGMIVSGAALLAKNANPSDAEILQAMQGNVCRCGAYPRIVEAIRMASRKLKTSKRSAV